MQIGKKDIGKKLIKVSELEEGKFTLYEFKPNLIELFYGNEYPYNNGFRQKARFYMEYLENRFIVYYLVDDNNQIVGLCEVHPGGKGRYVMLTDDDLIVGPYVIRDAFRGKGYAIVLLSAVLNVIPKGKSVYDWIQKDNIASRKTTEHVGGKAIYGLKTSGITRKLVLGDLNFGDYLLYKVR